MLRYWSGCTVFSLLTISLCFSPDTQAAEPCVAISQQSQLPAAHWRIGQIRFQRNDIFDLNDKHSLWFHRFANDYHVVTTESTLREDLLFQEGDVLDAAILAETERLLRSRRYLRHAEITPVAYCPATGTVDIEVRSWDNWSLLPRISLGHAGGETKTNLGLAEDNLWGTGNAAQIEYFSDSERDGYKLQFHSPNLSSSHWQTTLHYADTSDGESYRFNLAKPFYRLSSERAYNLDIFKEIKDISEYARGDVYNEYRSNQQLMELSSGWAFGRTAQSVQHLNFGVTQDQHEFSENNDSNRAPPDNRDLSQIWLSWDFLQSDYRELTNFFLWNRVEDINFGWQAQVRLGRLQKYLGADQGGWDLQTSLQKNFEINEKSWLVSRFSYRQLHQQQLKQQQLFQSQLQYIRHLTPQQVLLAQVQWSVGKNLYRDERISIGGDEGMRAFPLYYQTGNKAALASLEYRYITHWHIYQLLDVALAGFVDAGRAWDNPDRPAGPDDNQTLSGYGVGIRLLPSHASRGSVISIDLAKPVSDNPELSGWRWRLIAKRPF
jgi:outer membrane protein assembly factor BamA